MGEGVEGRGDFGGGGRGGRGGFGGPPPARVSFLPPRPLPPVPPQPSQGAFAELERQGGPAADVHACCEAGLTPARTAEGTSGSGSTCV